jgi:hypothetical protein
LTSSPERLAAVQTRDHAAFAPHLVQALEPDEAIAISARARDAVIAVTDRRMLVATDTRLAMSVPIAQLRRIQFDIERDRPATLVVVPELPEAEPQVLAIPADAYRAVADALVEVGLRFRDGSQR